MCAGGPHPDAPMAATSAASPLILLLLLLHLLLLPDPAAALRFDYATLTLGSLKLLGDAHLKNGTIRLSRDMPVPTSGAGRALYASAVPLGAGFSTQFAFTVATLNKGSVGGGLAFVVATDDSSVGEAGAYIGVDPAADAAAVEFDTLADAQFGDVNGNHVGLDLGSMVSAAVADLGEAAGVELTSGRTVNAWIEYSGGGGAGGGGGGVMEVFVSYAAKRPPKPVLSAPVDLGKADAAFVGFSASTQGSTEAHAIEWWSFSTASAPPPRQAPVLPPVSSLVPPPPPASVVNPVLPSPLLPGTPTPTTATVSAPTGSVTAAASAPAAHYSVGGSPKHPPRHAAVAGAATAGAFVAASFAGFAVWALLARRAAKKRRRRSALAVGMGKKRDSLASAAALARSPREFSYKELSAATRGFDASRVIGTGAFGTVYKGIVPDTGAMVAVKRCTNSANGGEQARSEFLSELSIIAGLRHRNLLRLQGWCYDDKAGGGEVLLVYDYMRNGSLDRALFDDGDLVLPWRHRREILAGVASALAYLHHECERRVIHRDVKSSNVMLDDAFRARLGDFGLARQAEHGASPDATAAAGTMGYLAPEYLLTGRATEATDVFSFGALALEVVCGRRPILTTEGGGGGHHQQHQQRCNNNNNNNLVEWVWSLHGEGRLLDAVDPRLARGEYDEGEVRRAMLVGLACSSPEPALRPGMRAVVQMLSGEADPPFVPAARPSMSLGSATNHQLLLSLQDSVSDYNALLGLDLTDSSSDSLSEASLTSTLRRDGHDVGAFSSTAGGGGGEAR